jgi:ankyrin repeat protein
LNSGRDNKSSFSSELTSTLTRLHSIVKKTTKSTPILNQPNSQNDHKRDSQGQISVTSSPPIQYLPRRQQVSSCNQTTQTMPFIPSLSVDNASRQSHNRQRQQTPALTLPPAAPATSSDRMSTIFRFRRHGSNSIFDYSRPKVLNKDCLSLDVLDQMMYDRARIVSNTRPDSSFTIYSRRDMETTSSIESTATLTNIDDSIALFDGAVANSTPVGSPQLRGLGGGSGTLQHLACAIDSVFGLSLVVAMGADASSRHTAFKRLVIHEAACCDSPQCLQLLLEMGKGYSLNKSIDKGILRSSKHVVSGCKGCQEDRDLTYDGCTYPFKRQKSNNCLLDLGRLESKLSANKGSTTECTNGRLSFPNFLEFALDIVEKLKKEEISEIYAARLIISKARLSERNKSVICETCTVDQEDNAARIQPSPQLAHFSRMTNVDGHGNTALHWAAFKNSASCVRLLLDFGANPNAVAESSGWTPLHDAAYSDSAAALSILIEAQADVNSKAYSGATPLCFAAQEDSPNVARLLLKAGADATIRCENDDSEIPKHHLYQLSRFSGYSPLHYCAHYNSHRAAIVILEHYAQKGNQLEPLFNIQDLNSKLPIHIVAERGSSNVMKELLHHGVHMDCQGSDSGNDITSQPNNDDDDDDDDDDESINSSDDDSESIEEEPANVPSSPTPTHTEIAVVTPISSPVLRSLIPSEPVTSSKPWNCLTQNKIDECKGLLREAELSWSPKRHYLFTPCDRVSIIEFLKVGDRLNYAPKEIWLYILEFCGRGWFNSTSHLAKQLE